MAKTFYTTEEAAQRLGKSEEALKALVRAGELREFRDGDKLNYRVDEIDKMANASPGESDQGAEDSAAGASGTSEIILEPAEDSGDAPALSGSDVLSLKDVAEEEPGGGTSAGTQASQKKKGSTVIPSIGVNVFDDDEFDEAVDPLAQTAVTDVAGLGMEGSGSGSGILDLTRQESDDTSLGAELLEEIYSGDEAKSGSDAEGIGEGTRPGMEVDDAEPAPTDDGGGVFEPETVGTAARATAVATIEYGPDAVSTGLTALIIVAVMVMWFAGLAGAALVSGVVPSILKTVYANLALCAGGSLGVGVIAAAVTFFLAKRSGS